MKDTTSNNSYDPTSVLQAAIEQIEVFTKQDAASLEVEQDGKLIAIKAQGLERIIGLARSFIGPLFSGQVRQEQQEKLQQIKKGLLDARDNLQRHTLLIEKLKEGDFAQRKLAERALEAINRYNLVVLQTPKVSKDSHEVFNYERNQLLLDEEIKGKEIRLLHTVSIKYTSDPNSDLAQKTLKGFTESFLLGEVQKRCSTISSTYKKSTQVMVDAFRMKARRHIQSHLQQFQYSSLEEVLQLIKNTSIEIEDDKRPELILVRQVLELAPGSVLILTGSFKKAGNDSKLMSIPILDDFHFTHHTIQTGFPYASQHTGWTLIDQFIEAEPLRLEHVPLFSSLDKRKKEMAQKLLFDPTYIAKAKKIFKNNKKTFDAYAPEFIQFHRDLHEAILKAASILPTAEINAILDDFYHWVSSSSSPFETLNRFQQELLNHFISNPAQKLQEEWLKAESSLRRGTYHEKLQVATALLQEEREQALARLDPHLPADQFMKLFGALLGSVGQSITLQYMSEKIGFAPPMLSDFEQIMQACTFQQALTFLDELEDTKEKTAEELLAGLQAKWCADIAIFKAENIEMIGTVIADLTEELEVYFNSRFYATNYRHQ